MKSILKNLLPFLSAKNMGKLIQLFLLAMYIYLCIANSLSFYYYALAIAIGIFRYRFIHRSLEFERPGRGILWLMLEFNFPLYIFMQMHFWQEKALNPRIDLIAISFCLLLLYFILDELSAKFLQPGQAREYAYKTTLQKIAKPLFACFTFCSFGAAWLGYTMGVGVMGLPDPELPFKLQKIILTTRMLIIPFLAMVFIDFFYGQSKSYSGRNMFLVLSIGFLIAFSVLESFLRGTRGMIFTMVIFLFLWRSTKGNLNQKLIVSWAFLVIPVIFGSYFVFTSVRNLRVTKQPVNLTNILNHTIAFNPLTNFNTYHRLFGNGYEVDKFSRFVDSPWFGISWKNFTKLEGAGIGFHTNVIDKVALNQGHSSGICGLSDGFLSFGYFGLILTLIFFALAMHLTDFKRLSLFSFNSVSQAQTYLLLLLMFFGGIGSISFLFRNPFYHLALLFLFLLQSLLVKTKVSESPNRPKGDNL